MQCQCQPEPQPHLFTMSKRPTEKKSKQPSGELDYTRDGRGKPIYDDKTKSAIRHWTKDCKTWLEARAIIAQRLGVHPDNVSRANKRKGPLWQPAEPLSGNSSSEFSVDVETSIPKTLDEVISLCAVDLKQWEAKSFGLIRKRNSYGWSARFQRKDHPVDMDHLLRTFIAESERHAPKNFRVVEPSRSTGRRLEIACMDVHFAKLCWKIETRGPDYDLKIAARDYKEAVFGLASHAKPNGVERIILPIGNDILNSDNLNGTTTAGTPQATSEDGRWQKAYSTVCTTVVEIVETLASQYGVDILIVSGNHDRERCYYLGEYLRAWFRNNPNVMIDNNPAQRKYYTFGTVLLGFTHGNEERHADLPLLMATEQKEAWAQTTVREIHVGHQHQEKVSEKMGVKTRVISALVPQDEWATGKGYIGNLRLAEAFLYDPVEGLLANYYHNILERAAA